jgi:hypothetical protein
MATQLSSTMGTMHIDGLTLQKRYIQMSPRFLAGLNYAYRFIFSVHL